MNSECGGQVISDSLIVFFDVDSRSKALGDKLPSFECRLRQACKARILPGSVGCRSHLGHGGFVKQEESHPRIQDLLRVVT